VVGAALAAFVASAMIKTFSHSLDRFLGRADRLRASAAHVLAITCQMPQPAFCHLTPSRIAGAEK
jgi:hypothetical protein